MRALEWRDVDLDGGVVRLRPELSKNKRARVLPLAGELREVIERAAASRQLDCVFVFHASGQPIGDFRKAWRSACASAGLAGLIPHDLRRSAIRNMVRAGVPEVVAMSLSGHRTRSIFDRYCVVDEQDLATAAQSLHAYLAEQGGSGKITPIGTRTKGGQSGGEAVHRLPLSA